MIPILVYIAGPYRAPNAWECEQNIRAAEALAIRVARAGGFPLCPHTNTRQHFEHLQPADFWLAGTLELLKVCKAAVFTADYLRSSGARAEMAWCGDAALPNFVDADGGFERFEAWLGQQWTGRFR